MYGKEALFGAVAGGALAYTLNSSWSTIIYSAVGGAAANVYRSIAMEIGTWNPLAVIPWGLWKATAADLKSDLPLSAMIGLYGAWKLRSPIGRFISKIRGATVPGETAVTGEVAAGQTAAAAGAETTAAAETEAATAGELATGREAATAAESASGILEGLAGAAEEAAVFLL